MLFIILKVNFLQFINVIITIIIKVIRIILKIHSSKLIMGKVIIIKKQKLVIIDRWVVMKE